MPGRSDIYKQVIKYFDLLSTDLKAQIHQKQEKIYNACPRVKEIDNELSVLGIKSLKEACKNGDVETVRIEFEKKANALKAEKIRIMEQNGFNEEFIKPVYKCEKCNDTGFINSKQCSCFTQKIVDLAYKGSNISDLSKSFDDFDISFYRNEKYDNEFITPRENIQNILKICNYFIENFNNEKSGLLFYGKAGLGKTFLCNCIAREIINKGYTVFYSTAGQLFKSAEKERFRRDEEEAVTNFSDDIQSVDLLIIDDLGTEFANSFTDSELFDILNTRLMNNKPVIISTNLSINNIRDNYSDRIASRIVGNYRIIRFLGDDIRIQKMYSH